MSIEKGLYAAPQGIEDLMDGENDPGTLEIEIEDPEAVHIGLDGEPLLDIEKEEDDKFDENLAEKLSESVLQQIASDLLGDFDDDISSRKDWIQTYTDGLELLGLKIEERAEPWEGACGVYHPLLAEALVKFQSETMMSTFPAAGPVKTQIIGKETADKKAAAERVQQDMNFQLMDVMKEYRPEHERMLLAVALSLKQVLMRWREEGGAGRAGAVRAESPRRPVPGNPFSGLMRVLSSPYLFGIAGFVILLATASTFLYFEQARLVAELFPDRADQVRVFGVITVPGSGSPVINIQGKGVQASQSWTLKAGAYLKITKTS